MSCEGATSIINFQHIEGDWHFYLDDFANEILLGGANDFTNYLNNEMSDKLAGDFDGFFWIENLDTQPHRIKMVPKISELPTVYPLPPLNNPTFLIQEDGSITFCLSPAA